MSLFLLELLIHVITITMTKPQSNVKISLEKTQNYSLLKQILNVSKASNLSLLLWSYPSMGNIFKKLTSRLNKN